MTKEQIAVQAISDQHWMALEDRLGDIIRIADYGFTATENDFRLIMACMCFLAAELHKRKGDREIAEKETK